MKIWNHKLKEILEASSLKEYIYSAYTPQQLADDLAAGDIFVTSIPDADIIYGNHAREIFSYVKIQDAFNDNKDSIEWNQEFYSFVKGVHLDAVIRKIMKEAQEKYSEIMQAHPKKKLSELVELAPRGIESAVAENLGRYSSLRACVEENFTGRELIGALGEKRVALDGTAADYYQHFSNDLKRLSGKSDLAAGQINNNLLRACVTAQLQIIYTEKKNEVIHSPEKKLAALGRDKDNDQGR